MEILKWIKNLKISQLFVGGIMALVSYFAYIFIRTKDENQRLSQEVQQTKKDLEHEKINSHINNSSLPNIVREHNGEIRDRNKK